MSDYMRRVGRFFLIVGSVPLWVSFIAAWSAGFGFILIFFGAIPLVAVLLVGSGIFAVQAVRYIRTENDSTKNRFIIGFAVPVMLGVTILLAFPLLRTGSYVGTWTRLSFNLGHYERIIEKVRREKADASPSQYRDDDGVTFIADYGPPVRVAFNPEGMLDNWSGIIFDPTHDVMQAKGFDPVTGKFVAPDRITKIFGGDLVECRHLRGDFFDCSFT